MRFLSSNDSGISVWLVVVLGHLLAVAYALGWFGLFGLSQPPHPEAVTPASSTVMLLSGRLVDRVDNPSSPSRPPPPKPQTPPRSMPPLPPIPAPPEAVKTATKATPTLPNQATQTLPAPAQASVSPSAVTDSSVSATASTKSPPSQSSSFSPPRTDAFALSNPLPIYPPLSRRQGEEGRVLLNVYILENGQVGEVTIRQSSSFSRLDQAALVAVRQWRYTPAKQGGVPLAYWYVQPLSFSLDSSEFPSP
jgi:protein TonB